MVFFFLILGRAKGNFPLNSIAQSLSIAPIASKDSNFGPISCHNHNDCATILSGQLNEYS